MNAKGYAQAVTRAYNPNLDTIQPPSPTITWGDVYLAHAVLELLERVEKLESQPTEKFNYDNIYDIYSTG